MEPMIVITKRQYRLAYWAGFAVAGISSAIGIAIYFLFKIYH